MPLVQRLEQDILTIAAGQKLTAFDGALDLADLVKKGLADGIRRFVLDLSDVEYIDSTGVGGIANSHSAAKNQGGRLVLVGLQPRVVLVLKMASLDLVLEIREAGADPVVW